jgi:hypothetical protein
MLDCTQQLLQQGQDAETTLSVPVKQQYKSHVTKPSMLQVVVAVLMPCVDSTANSSPIGAGLPRK